MGRCGAQDKLRRERPLHLDTPAHRSFSSLETYTANCRVTSLVTDFRNTLVGFMARLIRAFFVLDGCGSLMVYGYAYRLVSHGHEPDLFSRFFLLFLLVFVFFYYICVFFLQHLRRLRCMCRDACVCILRGGVCEAHVWDWRMGRAEMHLGFGAGRLCNFVFIN